MKALTSKDSTLEQSSRRATSSGGSGGLHVNPRDEGRRLVFAMGGVTERPQRQGPYADVAERPQRRGPYADVLDEQDTDTQPETPAAPPAVQLRGAGRRTDLQSPLTTGMHGGRITPLEDGSADPTAAGIQYAEAKSSGPSAGGPATEAPRPKVAISKLEELKSKLAAQKKEREDSSVQESTMAQVDD